MDSEKKTLASSLSRRKLKGAIEAVCVANDGPSSGGSWRTTREAPPEKELEEDKKDHSEASWREKFHKVMQHRNYMLSILSLTIFVLFADDMATVFFKKDADPVIHALLFVCLLGFIAEMRVLWWLDHEYNLFALYFWLDLVATVSLVPEIPWLAAPILESVVGGTESTTHFDTSYARTSRIARIGARAGRLIRMVILWVCMCLIPLFVVAIIPDLFFRGLLILRLCLFSLV